MIPTTKDATAVDPSKAELELKEFLKELPEIEAGKFLKAVITTRGVMGMPSPPRGLPHVEPNEGQIKDALKILKPKPKLRDQCREDIVSTLMLLDGINPLAPRSKEQRNTLDDLRKTFEKAARLKNDLAPSDANALNDFFSHLQTAINYCKEEYKQPSRKPGPSGNRPQRAVMAAQTLLRLYGSRDDKDFVGRGSLWHKLSQTLHGKALHGKPSDLFRYMRRRTLISSKPKPSNKIGSK